MQCCIISGVAGDVLSECGQGGGQRGMIEVPRDEEWGCGCCVCSELVTEWRTSQAASALAGAGGY